MTEKPTNPKDSCGVKKVPFSTLPLAVFAEAHIPWYSNAAMATGVGMLEGGLKYGRHNYRIMGVLGSVYYDASKRHAAARARGEMIDPDSGLPHSVKFMASIAVLRDAMMNDMWTDDRPPSASANAISQFNLDTPEGYLQVWWEGINSLEFSNIPDCKMHTLAIAMHLMHEIAEKDCEEIGLNGFEALNKRAADLVEKYNTPEMKAKGYPKPAYIWSDKPVKAEQSYPVNPSQSLIYTEWMAYQGKNEPIGDVWVEYRNHGEDTTSHWRKLARHINWSQVSEFRLPK